MPMITRAIGPLWVAVVLATGGAAFAQPAASVKPPHRQVQTVCPHCLDRARAVNQAYDGLNFLWDRKLALQKSIAAVETAIAERAATIGKLEAATPPSGRTRQQQQAIDSLREVNAAQQAGLDRTRRDLADVDRRIAEQQQRIAELMATLAACEKRCATPPADPPLTATAGPTPQITTRDDGTMTAFVLACPRCVRVADQIMALQEERADVIAALAELQLTLEFVLSGGSMTVAGDNLIQARNRAADLFDSMEDGADELAYLDAQLSVMWKLFIACIMNCNTVSAPFWSRPYLYGPAVAAGVLGTTLAGGDSTAAAPPALPPIATPPPATVPAPAPPPSAPPTPPSAPTAAGRYRCTAAAVINDSGRHHAAINLGPQLVHDFIVTDDPFTIRHPAPFIDIAGAQYDRATGRFSGDGRGTVAGVGNVGVRAEGTVDLSAGRIQFVYTMGTGGELPGGQTIAYQITLQKQ